MISRHTFPDGGNVRPFRTAAERDAGSNLRAMIAKARRANPIGVIDWDAAQWRYPKTSRASAASDGGLRFTLRSANARDPGVMPEPFMSFVKAIVCIYNQRTSKLYSAGQSQTLVAAARLLLAEIDDRGADPLTLRHGDFDAAARRAQENMGEGAANIGSKLAIIADEMDRHGLTAAPIRWRNFLRRDHKHDRIGEKAAIRRHAKLPSRDVLDALATISARADLDHRDLIVQRAIDLLACGGFRVNEVLTLPRNTIVEEGVLDADGRPALDPFGRPAVRVGLRYWPEKGGHEVAQIKWLPSVMVDVARRAVSDVLRITEPHARVARHQGDNPGSTLLGSAWDHLPGDHLLSTRDVARIVGLSTGKPKGEATAGAQFIRVGGLEAVITRLPGVVNSQLRPGRGHAGMQTFTTKDALCEYLHSQHGNALNQGVGRLDIADCLFLVPQMFVKRSLEGGLRGTVRVLPDSALQVYLVSQANGIQPSIFERLGFLDAQSKPLRVTTHGFRHLLNTLAHEGSMSSMEIARWMGRANPSQNAAYDHVSPVVRAQRLRDRILIGQAKGPVAEAALAIADPVRREEFIASANHAAHVTDLGYCVHPWDVMPCPEAGSCAGCADHRLIKGDGEARDRAASTLEQTEALLAIAETEDRDGTCGADNWLEAQRTSAIALRRVIAVHDDPTIPEGTVVQLARKPS
jgi:hypothetical protein